MGFHDDLAPSCEPSVEISLRDSSMSPTNGDRIHRRHQLPSLLGADVQIAGDVRPGQAALFKFGFFARHSPKYPVLGYLQTSPNRVRG